MKNALSILTKNKTFLFLVSFVIIGLDIVMACFGFYFIRLFISYLLIPVLICFALVKNHKSYIVLLIYELFISSLAIFDAIGISAFTYFWMPDTWHIINTLYIDNSSFLLPVWFQPIIFAVLSVIFALAIKKYRKKS